jgi:AcrR family transcriptional regulator
MPPRAYNNETRQLLQADLKARIAEAAAALHATQGALATSYAQIAQQAGVSLPTVYKHFPTLDDLMVACTGHVHSRAPEFPHQDLLAAPDLPSAAKVIVHACDALNAYLEPWLVWREAERIPALKRISEASGAELAAACRAVLQGHGVPGHAAQVAAVWESLLAFDFWHRLVHLHKLTRAAARERQLQLMLAAAGPQPDTSPSTRPNRKSRA